MQPIKEFEMSKGTESSRYKSVAFEGWLLTGSIQFFEQVQALVSDHTMGEYLVCEQVILLVHELFAFTPDNLSESEFYQ